MALPPSHASRGLGHKGDDQLSRAALPRLSLPEYMSNKNSIAPLRLSLS